LSKKQLTAVNIMLGMETSQVFNIHSEHHYQYDSDHFSRITSRHSVH
jgi:hypothetical protein